MIHLCISYLIQKLKEVCLTKGNNIIVICLGKICRKEVKPVYIETHPGCAQTAHFGTKSITWDKM
jgi:hypothetical protein